METIYKERHEAYLDSDDDKFVISKRCPFCNQRILDKVTITSGVIETKCPRCRHIVRLDLSFRRNKPHRRSYYNY